MMIPPRAQVSSVEPWPELPLPDWQDTYATLHLWTQIVGKIRLAQTPWTNHSWHVPIYVAARGLPTSPIPYGARVFQNDFDLIHHRFFIHASYGGNKCMALAPRSVADFHSELFAHLAELGLEVEIDTMPCEIADCIPFEQDHVHASYDAEYAHRFWRALVQADRVFKQFRARFIGKCSPVHFFWGSFDLAVTRFSGRTAPAHPGGVPHLPVWVAREAYSHELSSCGFWPGGGAVPYAAFYAYAYPEPAGYSATLLAAGSYNTALREFVLPYDDVRHAAKPAAVLLEFLQRTYEAAADLGHWDRAALERPTPAIAAPRRQQCCARVDARAACDTAPTL